MSIGHVKATSCSHQSIKFKYKCIERRPNRVHCIVVHLYKYHVTNMEKSILNEVLCKLCTAMTHIKALISACNKRMTMSCRTSVVSDRPNNSPLKVEVFNRRTTVLSGVSLDYFVQTQDEYDKVLVKCPEWQEIYPRRILWCRLCRGAGN